MGRVVFWKIWIALILLLAAPTSAQDNYVLFESGPVRPLALSPEQKHKNYLEDIERLHNEP